MVSKVVFLRTKKLRCGYTFPELDVRDSVNQAKSHFRSIGMRYRRRGKIRGLRKSDLV